MLNRSSLLRKVACAVLAVLTLPAFARAQEPRAELSSHARGRAHTRVTVTPFLGMNNPIGKLRADSTLELQQLMTLMIGTRMSLSLQPRLGLELTTGFTPVPSWVAQRDWQQTIDVPGRVAVASLRGRYVLNPDAGDGDLLIALSSGLGVIHRYGRVWEDVKGTTDAALAGGLTTRLHRVNSRLCYGLDFDGFLSRSGYTDYGDFRTSSRLHFDLVSSFALSFSL